MAPERDCGNNPPVLASPTVYRPRIGLSISIGIVVSLVATLLLLRAATPPPSYIFDPVEKYSYKHDDPPGSEQRKTAAMMLAQGESALAQLDFVKADLFFGHCIEIANLPSCHRRLSALLYVVRDGSARAHYLRSQ